MITGIQQIGVGTSDFQKTWDWYITHFDADVRILEDDTVAERMLPYTGGVPQRRHACIAVNLQGGSGYEIWQFLERKPEPCPFTLMPGDLGILAAKIKCRDIAVFHARFSAKWQDCGPVGKLPDGTPSFWARDLFGNWLQVVERPDVFIDEKNLAGGVVGAVIGVSDMEASQRFYAEILGYDRVLSDSEGAYDPSGFLPGAERRCRRVILGHAPHKGAFSDLFGASTIELVQALEGEPRKVYEGRFWGDPGFIQVCFDIVDMNAFKAFCEAKGHPFTVDSCPNGEQFDMGEASGRFTYVEDPDGTLLEFVETYKIPVVGKLGWYIDMMKRDPQKALPKFLFRMMGLVSRRKVKA